MLDRLVNIIKWYIFKVKNRKRICLKSRKASINAKYGVGVSIDRNTVVCNNVVIGDYSYVNCDSYIEKCTIGKYCSISSGVRINPGEHKIRRISNYPIENIIGTPEINTNNIVAIGNDVLISANVIILNGVTIGDGAVVGAGAVVTHDIPPYAIAGGGTG